MNGDEIVDSYKGHSLKMSEPDSEGGHSFPVIMDEFPSTSPYIGHGKDARHSIDWYRGLIDEYGYISGLGAPSAKNRNRKKVFVDLDNVMADYGGDFLRWATNGQLSPSPNDLTSLHPNEILCLDGADYAELKRRWRVEGHKRNMTVIPGTHGALRRLSRWYDVVIISSRPADKYDNIRGDTEYWLKQHGLQYSELVFTKEKFDYVYDHYDVDDVLAIFDDGPKNLVKFASKQTVQCYIVDRPYNRTGAPFAHRFRTLYDAACHFVGVNEPWKDER